MLRTNDAYLLDIRAHGAWADEDLVEIVHSNWPETIARYSIKGISVHHTLTTLERQHLRSKNGNAGVQTKDGTFYCVIGGGLVESGDNLAAVRWGDFILISAKSIEESVSALDADSIADEVLAVTGTRPDRLICRLAEFGRDHALISVANAAKPFMLKIPIEQTGPVKIDLRSR